MRRHLDDSPPRPYQPHAAHRSSLPLLSAAFHDTFSASARLPTPSRSCPLRQPAVAHSLASHSFPCLNHLPPALFCALRHAAAPVTRRHFVRHVYTQRTQSVRFKRYFFTRKRLFAGCIYVAAGIAWLSMFFELSADVEADDEQEDDDDEEYDEDEEYDDDILFIPLGWATPAPRQFYKGSDPEWQEFRKVAADTKRHDQIRKKLVSLLRTALAEEPNIQRLGKVDPAKGRYWLDISFPDGPPQEYQRTGIKIAEGYIALTRRSVDQINYHRLQRVLWPGAVASGALASAKYLWRVEMNKLRVFFGLKPKIDPTTDMFQRHLEAMQRAKQSGSQHHPAGQAPPNASELTVAKTDAPSKRGATAEKNPGLNDLASIPPQSIALSIFSNILSRKWGFEMVEPPRGTFVVSGLIEVWGEKARCVLDVIAAYDPLLNSYVMLRARPRLVQDIQQRPRGGS